MQAVEAQTCILGNVSFSHTLIGFGKGGFTGWFTKRGFTGGFHKKGVRVNPVNPLATGLA